MSSLPKRARAAALYVHLDVTREDDWNAAVAAAAFVEHVADYHRGAGLDHQPRRLTADAARCPRDQRYLSVQSVHHRPSSDGCVTCYSRVS